jgi:isopenicillin N synthase-like dioxygenase
MAFSFTQPAGTSTIPVVDIAGLDATDPTAKTAVVHAIRAACLDKGFLYCTGHGVDPALIAEVFAQSAAFFDRPLAEKLTLNKAFSAANRGYEPLGAQTLEAGAPPDRKEGYYIGRHVPADDPRTGVEFNAGPNVWPPDAADFQTVLMRYHGAMLDLAAKLLRGLALSLDLPEDSFDAFRQEPMATLRLLHYPPQPANPHPDEKGCGAHTDFGAVSILLQDDVGGLEVWDHDAGAWIAAAPMDTAFVVNLGDMIARWTNDRYRSTLHRVINRSGRERYSVPFFFSGRPDYRVECLPGCLDDGRAHYPPTTVEAHMKERYAQTYG